MLLSSNIYRRRPLTSVLAPLLLLMLAGIFSGCSRPVREDAIKVANAGSTAAKQMGEYYDTLSQDTIRTWELNAFSDGYAVASVEAKFDKEIAKFDKDIKDVEEKLKVEKQKPEIDELKAEKAELEKKKQAALLNKKAALLPTPLAPTRKATWETEIQEINKNLQSERQKPEPQQSKALIRILEASIKQKQDLVNSGSDQAATFRLYQQRYEAILVRKQMAAGLRSVYEQFGRLANYNAVQDVQTKTGELRIVLGKVLDKPIPNASPTDNSLIGTLVGDVIKELVVVQQNKAIRKASQQVVPALRHLSAFFDTEKPVYKSIPTLRASFSTQIAADLVENSTVISTALINDVLAGYELKWPEPQTPFTSKGMIRGIQGVIEARSKPLQKASQDTADNLSVALTQLIKLHEQLEKRKPLSLAEFAESSATIQLLLEQLKAKGATPEDVMEFLKLLSKEKKND